jgi:molybdopterin converting factor small subunit
MVESPCGCVLDPPRPTTKAVDLAAPRRDSGPATKEARLRILLYGRLADTIGRQIEIGPLEACSVGELRRRLTVNHPTAADSLERSRTVVGGVLVGDDHRLAGLEQVEFLPPVSGG